MSTHYFASDGSFGDATGLLVADTSALDADDWSMISEAPDTERLSIVRQMLAQAGKDANQLALFE